MVKYSEKHPMLMKNKEVKQEITKLLEMALGGYNYEVFTKVMNYLNESNFFEDPASTKYHLSCKGGLARHSLTMYRETAHIVDRINEETDAEIPDKSVIISCIFHDLCKAGKYEVRERNVKNVRGEWIKVPYYAIKDESSRTEFYGHGSGSVILLMELGVRLSRIEKEAILHHMGTSSLTGEDLMDRLGSFKTNKLAVACHLGDMASTFMIESDITNEAIEGLEIY